VERLEFGANNKKQFPKNDYTAIVAFDFFFFSIDAANLFDMKNIPKGNIRFWLKSVQKHPYPPRRRISLSDRRYRGRGEKPLQDPEKAVETCTLNLWKLRS
jgi:hypothetical protein